MNQTRIANSSTNSIATLEQSHDEPWTDKPRSASHAHSLSYRAHDLFFKKKKKFGLLILNVWSRNFETLAVEVHSFPGLFMYIIVDVVVSSNRLTRPLLAPITLHVINWPFLHVRGSCHLPTCRKYLTLDGKWLGPTFGLLVLLLGRKSCSTCKFQTRFPTNSNTNVLYYYEAQQPNFLYLSFLWTLNHDSDHIGSSVLRS